MNNENYPPEKAYAIINYRERFIAGLSLNEFAIVQLVDFPSKKHNKPYSGSKKYIALCTGLTERQVFSIINKLIEKGIIQRCERTGYLRVTHAYKKMIEEKKKQILQEENSMDYENISSDHEETSYNSNNIITYTNNINTTNILNKNLYRVNSPAYGEPANDSLHDESLVSNSIETTENGNNMYHEMIKKCVDMYDESLCDSIINLSIVNYGQDTFSRYLLKLIDNKERYVNEVALYAKFATVIRENKMPLP